LLAGIAMSSIAAKPAACASKFTASKSRMPIRGARIFRSLSNAALLALVYLPS